VKEVGRSVVLGGDGRADTPGHSAQYGTYSMVDLDEGVVVDIQLACEV
jgi:solute carrier family 8 (sodium/calcium exchanger)